MALGLIAGECGESAKPVKARNSRHSKTMHLFPVCDRGEDHVAESYCACRPTAQRDHDGSTLWVHRPLTYIEFDESDLLGQAEAILDATSIELWALAEGEKLAFKIVPFKSLEPIQLPKSKNRK